MTNGQLEEPQLELYDISQSPLFMEPIKTQLNSRILAQKGAFLNYEMLLSKTKSGITLIEELKTKSNTSLKIPRVILKIKYQAEKTLKEYSTDKQKIGAVKEALSNESNKSIEDLLQELKKEIDEFDLWPNINDEADLNEENKEEISHQEKIIYQDVLDHLRRKLLEFKYIEDDLFPDFEDYLKNRMKIFN